MKDIIKSILLGIVLIAGIVLIWKGLSKHHVSPDTQIQDEIDSLQLHSDSLLHYISASESKVKKMKDTIDSLENMKPQIVIRYVKKYKEIDSASVGTVVKEFDSIFAKSGIK